MARTVSVAVIGARTVRQGTGPWFAKHFSAAGADVCALLGTSAESAASAQMELSERFGLKVAAFHDWDAMLTAANPDLIAIATPADAHRDFLWKSHAARKAVLVEKPFVWDFNRDNVKDTEELITAYKQEELPLFVNTQWLETLDTFAELYPDCDMHNVARFEMNLSPTSTGTAMAIEALPHAWSMLCYLAGPGELTELNAGAVGGAELTLEGIYEGQRVPTRFRFTMRQCPEQPRPFAYSINGCQVDREIELTDYSMSLRGSMGVLALPDPLAARIARIVNLTGQNAYNRPLLTQALETRLLQQSIEAIKA